MDDVICRLQVFQEFQCRQLLLSCHCDSGSQDHFPGDSPHPLARLALAKCRLDCVLIEYSIGLLLLFPQILQVVVSSFCIRLPYRCLTGCYSNCNTLQPSAQVLLRCRGEIITRLSRNQRRDCMATTADPKVKILRREGPPSQPMRALQCCCVSTEYLMC